MTTNIFKNIEQLSSCLLVMFIAMVIGCTDHYDSLNTPSDRLSSENLDDSNLGQAFAHVQYTSSGGSGFQTSQNLFADLYAQYIATTSASFDSDNFVENGGWINSTWNRQYSTSGPELLFVEQYTEEQGMNIHNAMAKIWRVYHYHRTTDYWGPIIYSNYGTNETVVPYDSQEDVYMDFFETLDEAVSVLKQNTGGNAFGPNDLVYAGDVDKWLIFANSLRLRLAMRIVYVAPGKAQEEAEKAVADGVMMGNDDNAYVSTNEESSSPYTLVTDWGEFRMSAAMQSVLEGYEDPRKEVYWEEAANGGFNGARNGLTPALKSAELNESNSNMHEYWQTSRDAPLPVMRAAEVYFLRAEGALREWDMDGTTEDLYEEGIRRSMEEYEYQPIQPADIEEYLTRTNTPVALDYDNDDLDIGPLSDIPVAFETEASFERKLEQIITQKWIGLYPDGWEAWAEYRRTRYPTLYPIVSSFNPDIAEDEIFRRMTFVTGEYDNNTEATNEAINLLNGPDRNDTKLWWDAKPE